MTVTNSAEEVRLPSALAQLFRLMSKRRRRQFFATLGLMLLGALAELATIGLALPFLALLADPGSVQETWLAPLLSWLGADRAGDALPAAAILFMVAALVAGALRLQLAWSSQRFALGVGHELAVEVQRRILFQPYAYHVERNSSEIIASLEKVNILAVSILLQLMQAFTAAVLAAFIVAALVQVDAFTALLAAAAVGALYLIVGLLTRGRLRANSTVVGSAYEQRVRIIQESLGAIRDVIIDSSQAAYLDEFSKIDARFTRARAATAFIGAAPRFIIEAVGMVLIAALALAVTGREGSLVAAVPIIGAFALGAQRLLPLVQQIYQAWSNLAGHRTIASQVVDLLQFTDPPAAAAQRPVKALALKRAIRLDGVSFSYPGRGRPAIADVSLEIPRGARVGLIGKTGSGKSTLADLIMGLIEPQAGTILIDEIALTGATVRRWQRGLAHVPQAIFLADASIARNIALAAADAALDMDRIAAAARIAQLSETIEALPEGFATRVGERGVRLSGGQRQRLGLARAIYKDAPVLVLDEATSALDRETEAAVLAALDQLSGQGRTIIIIAHRHTTIEHCDLIVRLDGGRIVETGSHDAVLGRKSQNIRRLATPRK